MGTVTERVEWQFSDDTGDLDTDAAETLYRAIQCEALQLDQVSWESNSTGFTVTGPVLREGKQIAWYTCTRTPVHNLDDCERVD